MQTNQREVIMVFGKGGSGKTRFAQWHLKKFTRAVILEGGFKDENEFDGRKMPDFWAFDRYMEENRRSLFRVCLVPPPDLFPEVCAWVKVAGRCLFLIDEADRYLANGKVIPEEFIDLTKRGRHYGGGAGVSMVMIADNPFDFPISLRRQVDRFVIFNTAEPNDVDWLSKLIGREDAERCKDLEPGHALEYTRGTPGVRDFYLSQVGA